MKKMIFLIFLSFPILVFAQKILVDKKTKQVTVDGVFQFIIEKVDCGLFDTDCHFDVMDNTNNKMIRISFKDFYTPAEMSSSNPKGRVTYLEYIFLESKLKAEIDAPINLKPEKIAAYIVKNKLVINGTLHMKAIDEFVLIHGTAFSERARRNR